MLTVRCVETGEIYEMEVGVFFEWQKFRKQVKEFLQYDTMVELVDENLRKLNNELKGIQIILSDEYAEELKDS